MRGYYRWLQTSQTRSGLLGLCGSVAIGLAVILTDSLPVVFVLSVLLLLGVFVAFYVLYLRDNRRSS